MGCRHEVTRETESFEDLVAKWPDNSGISDAALGFQLKRIVREIGPRTLIVERDIDDVMGSFLKYMADVPIRLRVLEDHLKLLQDRLEQVHSDPLVRRIRYESLSDLNAVKWAMAWLKPGVDTSRAADVMRMNVQVNRKHALEEITQTHTGWHLKEYA
jgi:hypothetical protein